jgi:hypothetical protein
MKFLLVLKVCSALDGTCIPEKNVGTHDSWYSCARQGTVETLMLLDSIGEDLINKNKLFVAFSCQITNET